MTNTHPQHTHLDVSLIKDTDIPYELQVLRSPNDINTWLRYYWHQDADPGRLFVLKRACYTLRRSYKLWMIYLDLYTDLVSRLDVVQYNDQYLKVNTEFERALELLSKMPLLWVKYLHWLIANELDVTVIRRKFNESLRVLPLSQHHWIWPLGLQFADEVGGPTGALIYRRYLTFAPDQLELVLEKLMEFKDIEHALPLFTNVINDDEFVSDLGKSPLDLWLEFLDLLNSVSKPTLKHHTTVEEFIKDGLVKFPDQQGKLIVKLATYHIKHSNYNKAIQVFENGLSTVLTIRDFTMIYDSYTEFLESLVTKLMSTAEHEGNDYSSSELDFKLEKFEKLMDQRELLLNDVKIRQSPHDVEHWLHKATLYTDVSQVLQTYVQAITTIDPQRATKGLSDLWCRYSQVYETNGDIQTARTILDRAVKVPFNDPEELVNVWIHWSELELRLGDLPMAIKVLEIATRSRSKVEYHDRTRTVQERVHKSIKLWSFYLDLVETGDDLDKTCSVYDLVFELKIATPLTVINYANFLEEHNQFERAFKVYERGVGIFHYPVVFEIWNIYLTKAMKRGLSLERLRDLFDHALDGCPEDLSKTIYVLYSQLEEDQGSIQRSVKCLERGIDHVDSQSKPDLLELLIAKLSKHFGLSSTRPIYTRALEEILSPSKCIPFVIQFADTERQLHELDRARAILQHGSQLQSPQKSSVLWDWWAQFEVENGDKESYKEMLRWKRKANDLFNTNLNGEVEGFVKSTDGPKVSSINASEDTGKSVNPDAIELDI